MACFRECANCGKEFNPRGPQKVCSKNCRMSLENQKLAVETLRECKVCGIGFYGKGPAAYCSIDCKKENDRIYAKDRRAEKPNYKKEYRQRNKEKLKEMAKEYRLRTYTPKILHKECAICNSRFQTVKPEKKTCSKRCSLLNDKRRMVEYDRNRYQERKIERRDYHREWEENNPDKKIKYYLKSQLGFAPPPDLVEEATALRLLNRALREVD
jgi:predicted nucleic acid-binding Zn ribbon protein